MPLSAAQQEALLFHILTTTSTQTFNPNNANIKTGDQLLELIKTASGKDTLWRALGRGSTTVPDKATGIANRAIANSQAYETVANTVFRPVAGDLWGGAEHPDVATVMQFLGM
jgi:hypothetical protein